MLDPETDAAKIRAFFIHPDWARQGIGTLLLDACESAARAAGFTRFEMGATLTGAKLFAEKRLCRLERLEVPLEGDITLPIIHMVKESMLAGVAPGIRQQWKIWNMKSQVLRHGFGSRIRR